MEGDESAKHSSHLVPIVGENSTTERFLCSLCFKGGKPRPKNKQMLHIETHYNNAYIFGGHTMVMCKKGCIQSSHYHCYCCDKIYSKSRLISHLHPTDSKKCKVDDTQPSKYHKVKCNECSEEMYQRNLKAHLTRIHPKFDKNIVITPDRHHDGICIDQTNGIYLISESLKGNNYPIHVQKCILGNSVPVLQCESKGCEFLHTIAGMSNRVSYECPHLQSVQFITSIADQVILKDDTLDKLITEKRLKPETKQLCLHYKKKAEQLGNILISAWTPASYQSGRYLFLSVWVGEHHHYCKTGRVLLTFDHITHNLCCCCSHSTKKGCLHKAVAKWLIFETMPSSNSGFSMVTVPSLEKGLVEFPKMIKYLMQYAKLPFQIPCEFLKEKFDCGMVLSPTEKTCVFCKSPLTDRVHCKNGLIFTRFGVVKNITVWNKNCEWCNVDYWHNNISSGLFNCDNRIFISLDWLVWLRGAVQVHTAIGNEVRMMESRYGCNVDVEKVRKGYFKFESLMENIDEQFKCCLCGYHPVVLTFDVIRKCAFKMPYKDVNCEELDEKVDVEKFWGDVAKVCISDGSGQDASCNKLVPLSSYWAPWIPKETRNSNFVYNTEHLKGSHEKEENEYLKCLSEERLEEIFNMGDLSTLRELCCECGINARNSTKIDCIVKLKSAIQSVADIDKLFFKVWQASGGTLTATCPHGITYAIKYLLKAESPRDVGDIVLSMKYPPNIIISDIPHMVASHINKRSSIFFGIHAGRVAEPSEANIQSVNNNTFTKLSFPWLDKRKHIATSGVKVEGTNIHPLTLVNQRLSLYDKFHQGNTKQPKEFLRRTGLIKELDGVITETAEHLNSFLSKGLYFLDCLSPIHHIQMVRFMLAERNRRKNNEIIQKANKMLVYGSFSNDIYGRVCIGQHAVSPSTEQKNADPSVSPTPLPSVIPGLSSMDHHLSESMPVQTAVSPLPSSMMPTRNTWLYSEDLFTQSNNNEFIAPNNAPFLLMHDDLETLHPSKFILGQVLDALLIIFSDQLFKSGVKTFILPESFFTHVNQDVSLESVIPKDCTDIDSIVAVSFYNSHWSLVLIDIRKKYILYLDPIRSGYVNEAKISADLLVIKTIIWYSLMNNPLESELPSTLPDWKVVQHKSFSSVYNMALPHQEHGNDCGMFVIMYFWYISHGAKFDFCTNDMCQIRKWCHSLLVKGDVYEDATSYISWLLSKMQGSRLGCLTLQDISSHKRSIHEGDTSAVPSKMRKKDEVATTTESVTDLISDTDSDTNSEAEDTIVLDDGVLMFVDILLNNGELEKYISSDAFLSDSRAFSLSRGNMSVIEKMLKYSFSDDTSHIIMKRLQSRFPTVFCIGNSNALNSSMAVQHYITQKYLLSIKYSEKHLD